MNTDPKQGPAQEVTVESIFVNSNISESSIVRFTEEEASSVIENIREEVEAMGDNKKVAELFAYFFKTAENPRCDQNIHRQIYGQLESLVIQGESSWACYKSKSEYTSESAIKIVSLVKPNTDRSREVHGKSTYSSSMKFELFKYFMRGFSDYEQRKVIGNALQEWEVSDDYKKNDKLGNSSIIQQSFWFKDLYENPRTFVTIVEIQNDLIEKYDHFLEEKMKKHADEDFDMTGHIREQIMNKTNIGTLMKTMIITSDKFLEFAEGGKLRRMELYEELRSRGLVTVTGFEVQT